MYRLIFLFVFIASVVAGSAQEIMTYKGKFPECRRVYMLYPIATYSYYEGEDYSRVFHGPFSVKFHGDGSTNKSIIYGTINGQFKNGYYDGEWTFVYPMVVYGAKTGRKFTATLKCNFVDGKLDGPAEMTIVNRAKKVISRTIINYTDGKENGEFLFFNEETSWPVDIIEAKGQYLNGERVGRWTYSCGEGQGIDDYDKDEYFIIDPETGARKDDSYLESRNMCVGNTSIYVLMNALYQLNNNKEKKFEYNIIRID